MEAGSETTTAPGRRRDRRRTLGYVVTVVPWVLVIPPLAAKQIEGGDSIDVAAAFTAVVVYSLGGAALIRFLYGLIRKRPVMSPWLFLLATVLGVLSLAGQSSGT